MLPPSHGIAKFLDRQGVAVLGATSGWRLAANVEESTPDNALTVYDTGGGAPELFDEELMAPTIQVRARSYDYGSAYVKQMETFQALNGLINESSDGYRYLGAWLTSDISHIGRDENDRHLLTANYQIERHAL